jgi:Trk K+ transport system NAD-binding subunit/Kef-type K+ transport system membrane component KefB
MANVLHVAVVILGFIVIALASKQIGQFATRFKLPLITGFLIAGIATGPFGLNLITTDAIENLRIIDEISLAVIAFAAGSELFLKELRSRFRSIAWVTVGLVVWPFLFGSLAVLVLADWIPFTQGWPIASRLAVAMLAGAILVARSPSSAIAIINELRAKGPFTQTALGVTVISDVLVILLFAFASSFADAILTDLGLDIRFVLLLMGELLLSLAIGYGLGKLLEFVLSQGVSEATKTVMILIAGTGIFVLADWIRDLSHAELITIEIFLEPLLICMIGSFFITNFSRHRNEFSKILQVISPPIYVIFFTLTGASLALDVLATVWPIALILFAVRLAGIYVGALTGGMAAGDPMRYNTVSWMTYITQAGVGLGLAKEVAGEFPEWGTAFATLIIAVIVLNQLVGPPLFKWAINHVGEAHVRGTPHEFDGVRDAIIFGYEDQAMAVARQLHAHGWDVKIACKELNDRQFTPPESPDVSICPVPAYSLDILHQLDMDRAEAIVTMLSDDDNLLICELAYEHFGTKDMIVRLNDRANFSRFHELGALIVDPSTAMVSLFDHLVRSPVATSMLLGMEEGQDIIDIEVRDPSLDGVALRNLRLPDDVLILSVQRDGHVLISHGYTRLKVGDHVTVMGSDECLEEVMLKLGV